jgi:hypothetical protein
MSLRVRYNHVNVMYFHEKSCIPMCVVSLGSGSVEAVELEGVALGGLGASAAAGAAGAGAGAGAGVIVEVELERVNGLDNGAR